MLKNLLIEIINFFYKPKQCPTVYYRVMYDTKFACVDCSCDKCKMELYKIARENNRTEDFKMTHRHWFINKNKNIKQEFTKVLNSDLVGVILKYF